MSDIFIIDLEKGLSADKEDEGDKDKKVTGEIHFLTYEKALASVEEGGE